MSEYNEYYANRKPSSFAQPLFHFWHQRMFTIAAKYIPHLHTKTILEIGSGHGFFAAVCKKIRVAYSGHEMNAEQAHALQQLGHEVTPATIPPIPAGKPVQIIWLSHVLEHASSYREAKDMLHACHERLDPEGHVVIISPDIHHWKTEFWSCDWSHGFPTSLNRVEQLFSETGFTTAKAMHHTCTITNPFLAWLISWSFRLALPINLLDFIFQKTTGHRFCHAFMSVFGLRQIYLIAKKNGSQ